MNFLCKFKDQKKEDIFKIVDHDGDGTITKDQLTALLKQNDIQFPQKIVEFIFTEGNTVISKKKFMERVEKKDQKLQKMFQRIDTDNSGTISKLELKKAFHMWDYKITE